MTAERYTLLLKSASYFIDTGTRERVLEARRLGRSKVSFQPAIDCYGCARSHTVTISPADVLAFIAHDEMAMGSADENIIPFPLAR